MATTYPQIYAVIYDKQSTLRKQVVVALRKARTDVMNNPGETNHLNRVAWVNQYANVNDGAQVDYILGFVLDNSTIVAALGVDPEAILDSDVQFVVNSLLPVAA